MRYLYNFNQATDDFTVSDPVEITGTYVLSTPPGVVVPVDTPPTFGEIFTNTDYGLISLYQNFSGIVYGYMNTSFSTGDISVDLTGSVDNSLGTLIPAPYNSVLYSRKQISSSQTCYSALLPNLTDTFEPGLIVTSTINVPTFNGGSLCDQMMVYWKIHKQVLSHDVIEDSVSDVNTPVKKYFDEVLQDLSGNFVVGISIDGADFIPVERLEILMNPIPVTNVKLCFVNLSTDKIYIENCALMFNAV